MMYSHVFAVYHNTHWLRENT